MITLYSGGFLASHTWGTTIGGLTKILNHEAAGSAGKIRQGGTTMKQVIIIAGIVIFVVSAGVLYSSKRAQYQVVEVFVCDDAVNMAEMVAKSSISRQDLMTVSYCTCEGVDPSMKTRVKKSKCEAPKNLVYSCSCIGKTNY
jgi:hypothetical protein